MRLKHLLYLTLLILTVSLVPACGDTKTSPVYESVSTATYKIEYIPVTAATLGKSTYKVRITNLNDGKPVPGKTVSLMPTMYMAASSNHSTPFEAIKDNSDGTYSGTIYYVMASTAFDTWELKFTIDGETATFKPTVTAQSPPATTALVKLKGINDLIGSMTMGGAPVSRTYQLFNEGISGSTAAFFLSAVDDSMMMTFPAVSIGTTLHDPMNMPFTIDSTSELQVSTDGSTWQSATDNGSGHWSASGLSGLVSGGTVWVKLSVNGEQKTTDGAAVGNTNGYQKFSVI